MKISIIIPAYNEEKRIGKTLDEYVKFFNGLKKQKKLDFEIIVVINNTRDNTERVVKEFSKDHKEIKYLNFKQRGKGFAIIEGFKDSLKRKNELIGFVDADMATSPEEFYKLIKNINGYGGIIASRAKAGAVAKMRFMRMITHRGFNFLVRSILSLPFRDTQCGAKIFTRRAIKSIIKELGITQWGFDIDLLYRLNKKKFRIKEIPTIWVDKRGSNLNLTVVPLKMFASIIRLRILNSPIKNAVKLYDKLPEWIKIHHKLS